MIAVLAAALAFAAPPPADAPFLCVCRKDPPPPDVVFRGVAVDAELRASEDGREVAARQATVFRVLKTIKGETSAPMKVWHVSDPGKCGVTFAYGQTYVVEARLKNGVAETDLCLMPALKPKDPE